MSVAERQVYIVSDLHIGGAYPAKTQDRGFRMMNHTDMLARFIRDLAAKPTSPPVELVINGDFVDFLAEEQPVEERWLPFLYDPQRAVDTFDRIAARPGERAVFSALGELLQRGHALTVLLGNHDIELSLPAVRHAFEAAVGVRRRGAFLFIYDGEGYEVGDALIEHGNRYDPANAVDHDGLRRLRSLQSRRQYEQLEGRFAPPAGSRLVAELMNPIKDDYAFIDLLKPESEPLFAFLLVLEPRYRKLLARLAALVAPMATAALVAKGREEVALPSYDRQIGADGLEQPQRYGSDMVSAAPDEGALREVVACAVGADGADEILAASSASGDAFKKDVGSGLVKPWMGLAQLLATGESPSVERRLTMIRRTLRALEEDRSFDDSVETCTRYLDAAADLARGRLGRPRYRFVIFGHTHHAKSIPLQDGAQYLNTGTWANLMRFPVAVNARDEGEALAAIRGFLEDLRHNRLDRYIEFRPTYVRLDVGDDGHVMEGKLCEYLRHGV